MNPQANQRTQQLFNAASTVNYTQPGEAGTKRQIKDQVARPDAMPALAPKLSSKTCSLFGREIPIGQLKVADSATASEDRGYLYDAAWNLNFRTNNTTLNSFFVNVKNELTSSTVSGVNTYDGNGNRTESHPPGPDRFYTYDDENQLVQMEREEVWRTELIYDGRGRLRVRKEYDFSGDWNLTSETRYVYDGWRVIQERNSSDVPQVSYTRGTDLSGTMEGAGGIGGLLARSHSYSSGNWSTHNFYHADGNGNVTYLVNSSQTLAAKYRYDPYGNTISSSGSLAAANTYRFSSKELHVNSGLYYYGFRWYDPNTQTWPNQDPIGEAGGINLYRFVRNNPIRYVDPYGLAIGDWWDARTWFNSGFTESWSDSANSIGQALGGALSGNWDQVADAYDSGIFGQTQDADPFTYYGTRGAVGVATACTAAACAVGTLQAAGCSTMNVAIGPGQPFHVAYGTGGNWVHAAGNTLGRLRVTSMGAEAYATGEAWFTVTGIPVLYPGVVLTTGPAATCIGAACRAFGRGWGL